MRFHQYLRTGFCAALGLSFVVAFTGCNKEEVKVYRVAKEKETPPESKADHPWHPGHDEEHLPPGAPAKKAPPEPKISWKLPEGWTEAGRGQMSLASFNIKGASEQRANVAVTPLAGMSGREMLVVNMWRKQVGQSVLSDEEATKQLTDVDVGGQAGKMFEIAGKSQDGESMRIVTALTHRGNETWFYKLQGDDELVTAQKAAFVTFLKSIKIEDAPKTATPDAGIASVPPAAGSSGAGKWTAPAAWNQVAPGPMQDAKFSVPAVAGAKADVTISIFPGSTGSNLANVNRWRGQIGLAPVDEAGLAALLKPLDEKSPDAAIVDLSHEKRRLIGAIVPAGGKWYFYKLMGDAAAVAPQKDAFVKFVKDVKY